MLHVAPWYRSPRITRAFGAIPVQGRGPLPFDFGEWEKTAKKQIDAAAVQGVVIKPVIIHPDEFVAYCNEKKLSRGSKGRCEVCHYTRGGQVATIKPPASPARLRKWRMRGYGARDDPILHAGLLRSHVKNDELLALVDQSAKLVDGDAVHAKLPNERPPPPPSCQPRTARTPNLPIFIQRPHDPAQRNWSASVRECSRNIRKRTATENFPRAKHHRPCQLPFNGVAQ